MRKTLLLSTTAVLLSCPVFAGVPIPCSVIGNNIVLGGVTAEGVVDARAIKQIVVLSFGACDPVQGASVTIFFSNCSDIRLSEVQPHHPGAEFNCAAKTVTATTDAQGIATFRIAGGADNASGIDPPGSQTPCADVRADGVLLGTLRVGAYDQNLVDGVNALDFARFMGDLFPLGALCGSASYRNRSDLDGSCSITALDGSMLLGAVLPLGQVPTSYAICP